MADLTDEELTKWIGIAEYMKDENSSYNRGAAHDDLYRALRELQRRRAGSLNEQEYSDVRWFIDRAKAKPHGPVAGDAMDSIEKMITANKPPVA